MRCSKYVANGTLGVGQKKVAIVQINLEKEKKILSAANKDASLDNVYFKEIYKFFNIIGKTAVAIAYQEAEGRARSNILVNKGRIIQECAKYNIRFIACLCYLIGTNFSIFFSKVQCKKHCDCN